MTISAPPRPSRWRRWSIAAVIAAALLAVFAVALDQMATRIGEDAASTMRATPLDDDTRHRSD
ncbi:MULTISPECIES: hypothetical protein [Luteimonas]|uniref:hypothetical protein n=1 Tax=Luteimonas TaxID=83614 RepID=UPI000C7D132A|nr:MULTISPECIES: hypothetical protein [Luteimonas]